MRTLPLHALTLDEELQPRATIDHRVLEEYGQLLVDGVQFPPVVAFDDGAVIWLSDGFHRWHSRNALELEDIEVEVRNGTRLDALLHSLSANAKHGLQRGATDYRRAYDIACRNKLVDKTDSDAVARLLQCSGSWADKLTESARAAAKARRDAEIVKLKDEGKGTREIARKTGVPRSTVHDTVRNQRNAESGHSHDPEPDEAPLLTERAKENLRELATPAAKNWSAAVRALRLINEQVSVDALFEDRFDGFDHVVAEQLEPAFEWISELYRRFVDERQHQRRRA